MTENLKQQNDLLSLKKMKKHCEEILEYLDIYNYSIEEFYKNHLFRNALSMAMFTIQELSYKGLSEKFIEENREALNWGKMKGMRNRFGHSYDQMDLDVIFFSAIDDIPEMNDFLEIKIKELEKEIENEEEE